MKGGSDGVVATGKGIDDVLEDEATLEVAAHKLTQRDGVGGVAEEALLVDIDAAANDAAVDEGAAKGVLDEDAGNLLVADVDIVGPLDGDGVVPDRGRDGGCWGGQEGGGRRQDRGDSVADAQGDGFGEEEEMGGRQRGGRDEEAKEEVLAAGRLPVVASLAATGRLVLGRDKGDGGGDRRAVGGEEGVGGRGLIQLYHVETGGRVEHGEVES